MKDFVYHKPASAYVEMWARWDSEWYLLIADHGYNSFEQFKDFGGGSYRSTDVAKFFPLYPWTISIFNHVTGSGVLSGILISNTCAVLFLYYFYHLGMKLFDAELSARSSLFYIFFPTSFFCNAVYSEAFFLASLAAAFYYLEQKKLVPALLASGFAVLCRPTGILAAPALLWLSGSRFPEKRFRSAALMLIVCLLSLSVYVLTIWKTFGGIQGITESQNYWRGQIRYPFYALIRFFSNPVAIHGQHNSMLDFSFAVLQILGLVVSIRVLPPQYYLLSIIFIVFPLSSSLFSFSRLCLVNFPFFLVLGHQLSGRWAFVLQILSAMLLAFFMAAFANWYWVG